MFCCFKSGAIFYLLCTDTARQAYNGSNDLMTKVSIRKPNLTLHKRSRPPKNIDYLHVVELETPMLHGKSHYHYLYLLLWPEDYNASLKLS